jgi:alpha-ketoglutarate-dependent taurine dioxygenase
MTITMEISRYRLDGIERLAVRNILSQLAPQLASLESDKVFTPAPDLSMINFGSTRSYGLNLRSCDPADVAIFRQLGSKLARPVLFASPSPVVVLEDLPIDEYPLQLLLLLGQMFGTVDEYFEHGAPVDKVADRGNVRGGRPRSSNSLRFPLHTDLSFDKNMPGLIYFLIVNQASAGGESIFCDGQTVVDRLSAESLEALQRPYRFPAPPHRQEQPPLDAPILEFGYRGKVMLRYRRDGLEPLGTAAEQAAQTKALEEFEALISEHTVQIKLGPGQLAIWRNREVLHGRGEFQDTPEAPGGKRIALRAYVTSVA